MKKTVAKSAKPSGSRLDTPAKAARRSNFELLRILAMLMIIAHHFCLHGKFSFGDNITLNSLWVTFFGMNGKLGVDLFILIAGYFGATSKSLRVSRVIRLWLMALFYAVGIYLVLCACGISRFKVVDLLVNCLPISSGTWWFLTCFFIVTLLSPLLSRFYAGLSRSGFRKLLLVMTVVWSLFYTLLAFKLYVNEFVAMVYVYTVGAYIRLWRDDIKNRSLPCILSACGLALVRFGLTLLTQHVVTEEFKRFIPNYFESYSLFIVVEAVLLFTAFKNFNIGSIKWINAVSAATLGVYLIHDYPSIRWYVVWTRIFSNASHAERTDLIPYSLFAVAAVFVACTAAELLRIHLIERWYMKPIVKKEAKINGLIDRVCDKILKF